MKHFYKIKIFVTGETEPTLRDYKKDKGLAIHDYAFYKNHFAHIDRLELIKDDKVISCKMVIKGASRYALRKEGA